MDRRSFISTAVRNNVTMPTCTTACYDTVQSLTGQIPQAQHCIIGNLGPSPGLFGTRTMFGAKKIVRARGTITTDGTPITFNVGVLVGYATSNAVTVIGSTGVFTPPANLSAVPFEFTGEIDIEAIYPVSVTGVFRFNGKFVINSLAPSVYPIRNTGTNVTIPVNYVYAKTFTTPGSSSATNFISWEETNYLPGAQEV